MEKDKYDDGYKTGKNWKRNYFPGGPFADYNNKESVRLKKLWLEGFHDGLEVNRYKSTPAIKELSLKQAKT